MKKISNYFKEKKGEYILLALLLLSTMGILYLFEMPADAYFVLLLLYGLIATYYTLLSFSFYKRQADYRAEIVQLKRQVRTEEEEKIRYRNDLRDYFLIWLHQIKTLLTSLALLAESLGQKEKETLKMLIIAIENYTEMALTYLKLSDFSADMEIRSVEISHIVNKLLKKYRTHFISSGTKLVYKPFCQKVVTDANYLEIMIEQLLNNALKYASGTEITIGFEADYFFIRDKGLGIAEEKQAIIFSRGYSAGNQMNSHKSSGIGLYVVQQISQKLDHPVEVFSSVEQHFSEFRIHFPTLSKL
ncbi:sensor histidine kinase [Allofustis seminis]|uniref:sensor histidine kinase n=1 Tax=Allofustis seminis TaxID=166939 RepID=UPI00036B95F3|nr:sensor histidine kinase [Allofustis seminis]